MPTEVRERMLASYPDMNPAMVAQNVLEGAGIPCRVADLANLPQHALGIAGGLGRAVGLWVVEADLERAASLIADLHASENSVDEEALAAEALATAPDPGAAPGAPVDPAATPQFLGRIGVVLAVFAVAAIAGLIVRALR